MSAVPPFDPYREWLDIEPEEQPADFYRLLGLPRFEADQGRIARAADERMKLVRSFQTGPRGGHTQKVLNELASARICLLNSDRKHKYDAALAKDLTARAVPIARDPEPPPIAELPPRALRPQVEIHDESRGIRQTSRGQPAALQRPTAVLAAALLALLAGLSVWAAWRSSGTRGRGKSHVTTTAPKNVPTAQPPARMPPAELHEERSGELIFLPEAATLVGNVTRLRVGTQDVLTQWTTADAEASWRFRLAKPGFFKAELTYATAMADGDMELELILDDRPKTCSLRSTGGTDQFVADDYTVAVRQSGEHVLSIRAKTAHQPDWLILKAVRLIRLAATGEREALAP